MAIQVPLRCRALSPFSALTKKMFVSRFWFGVQRVAMARGKKRNIATSGININFELTVSELEGLATEGKEDGGKLRRDLVRAAGCPCRTAKGRPHCRLQAKVVARYPRCDEPCVTLALHLTTAGSPPHTVTVDGISEQAIQRLLGVCMFCSYLLHTGSCCR